MTVIIVETPRGLFNIFSSDANGFVAKDLTAEQVEEWYAIAAKEMAKDLIKQIDEGKNPFGEYGLSYEAACSIHEEFNSDSDVDDIPVVNPQFRYA